MMGHETEHQDGMSVPLADLLSLDEGFASADSPPPAVCKELPRLVELASGVAPAASEELGETGIEESWLTDLAVKLASTLPQFTTAWAADRLHLPLQLVDELLWRLKGDHLVEVLGQERPFSYRYAATQRGREFAARLFELCGYLGPAPVNLESYARMIELQSARRADVTLPAVQRALSDLELTAEAVEIAALAASSGRSLFLFGPPGNGKTSLGRLLHQAIAGDIWIPHCIQIDGDIIRIFDPQQHQVASPPLEETGRVDHRWVRIRRPFIIAGGEMTIDSLDLAYSSAHRFYEAPLHLKANGGTFLIDDLGRQRVDPHALLNRWIVPLEHRIDYLSLNSGQKIATPFRLMLIVATNLTVADVADPAFLRRMGYRLHLSAPTGEQYARIFSAYAEGVGMQASPELIQHVLARYQAENRPLRASEPRDLIERAQDICLLRGAPAAITPEILHAAWTGYFGGEKP